MTPAEHREAALSLLGEAERMTLGSPAQLGLASVALVHATLALHKPPAVRKPRTPKEAAK